MGESRNFSPLCEPRTHGAAANKPQVSVKPRLVIALQYCGTQMSANPGTLKLLQGCRSIQPQENWQYQLELNTRVPLDPAMPLLGVHPTEVQVHVHRRAPRAPAALRFLTASNWNLPKCASAVEWQNKLWYPLPTGCATAMRTSDLQTRTTIQMSLTNAKVSERSQAQKSRCS